MLNERARNVLSAFEEQAAFSFMERALLTRQNILYLHKWLQNDSPLARRILAWDGNPSPLHDVLPLRLVAALHFLVLSGRAEQLAEYFPLGDHPEYQTMLGYALETNEELVAEFLKVPPQTNEVARASLLFAGLGFLANQTQIPVELFEIGASAGLNLNAELYQYEFEGRKFGNLNSEVILSPGWQGPAPDVGKITMARRLGCDLFPFDLSDIDQECRLKSYVWPEQAERMDRLSLAVKLARSYPPEVIRQDAVQFVEDRFLADGEAGKMRVLWHSIALQYFPEQSQKRIRHIMEKAGAKATKASPVAWLSFEFDSKEDGAFLDLTLWPEKKKWRLASADPHGSEIRWLAP